MAVLDESARKRLYNKVIKIANIGNEANFNAILDDDNRRKKLYDKLSEKYNVGTQEEFDAKYGPGKSEPAATTASSVDNNGEKTQAKKTESAATPAVEKTAQPQAAERQPTEEVTETETAKKTEPETEVKTPADEDEVKAQVPTVTVVGNAPRKDGVLHYDDPGKLMSEFERISAKKLEEMGIGATKPEQDFENPDTAQMEAPDVAKIAGESEGANKAQNDVREQAVTSPEDMHDTLVEAQYEQEYVKPVRDAIWKEIKPVFEENVKKQEEEFKNTAGEVTDQGNNVVPTYGPFGGAYDQLPVLSEIYTDPEKAIEKTMEFVNSPEVMEKMKDVVAKQMGLDSETLNAKETGAYADIYRQLKELGVASEDGYSEFVTSMLTPASIEEYYNSHLVDEQGNARLTDKDGNPMTLEDYMQLVSPTVEETDESATRFDNAVRYTYYMAAEALRDMMVEEYRKQGAPQGFIDALMTNAFVSNTVSNLYQTYVEKLAGSSGMRRQMIEQGVQDYVSRLDALTADSEQPLSDRGLAFAASTAIGLAPMAVDVATQLPFMLAGAVGGAAGRGITDVVGKWFARGTGKEIATRATAAEVIANLPKFQRGIANTIVKAASSAANFATFDAQNYVINGLSTGELSVDEALAAAGEGAGKGALLGALGFRGTSRVGKLAAFGTEVTAFTIPEFVQLAKNGESAWQYASAWLKNAAMVGGMKLHGKYMHRTNAYGNDLKELGGDQFFTKADDEALAPYYERLAELEKQYSGEELQKEQDKIVEEIKADQNIPLLTRQKVDVRWNDGKTTLKSVPFTEVESDGFTVTMKDVLGNVIAREKYGKSTDAREAYDVAKFIANNNKYMMQDATAKNFEKALEEERQGDASENGTEPTYEEQLAVLKMQVGQEYGVNMDDLLSQTSKKDVVNMTNQQREAMGVFVDRQTELVKPIVDAMQVAQRTTGNRYEGLTAEWDEIERFNDRYMQSAEALRAARGAQGMNEILQLKGKSAREVSDYFNSLGEADRKVAEDFYYCAVAREAIDEQKTARVEGLIQDFRKRYEPFVRNGVLQAAMYEGQQVFVEIPNGNSVFAKVLNEDGTYEVVNAADLELFSPETLDKAAERVRPIYQQQADEMYSWYLKHSEAKPKVGDVIETAEGKMKVLGIDGENLKLAPVKEVQVDGVITEEVGKEVKTVSADEAAEQKEVKTNEEEKQAEERQSEEQRGKASLNGTGDASVNAAAGGSDEPLKIGDYVQEKESGSKGTISEMANGKFVVTWDDGKRSIYTEGFLEDFEKTERGKTRKGEQEIYQLTKRIDEILDGENVEDIDDDKKAAELLTEYMKVEALSAKGAELSDAEDDKFYKVVAALSRKGYELNPGIYEGAEFTSRDNAKVQYEDNPSLAIGREVVKKLIKPEVKKDGAVIQQAEVVVERGTRPLTIDEKREKISQYRSQMTNASDMVAAQAQYGSKIAALEKEIAEGEVIEKAQKAVNDWAGKSVNKFKDVDKFIETLPEEQRPAAKQYFEAMRSTFEARRRREASEKAQETRRRNRAKENEELGVFTSAYDWVLRRMGYGNDKLKWKLKDGEVGYGLGSELKYEQSELDGYKKGIAPEDKIIDDENGVTIDALMHSYAEQYAEDMMIEDYTDVEEEIRRAVEDVIRFHSRKEMRDEAKRLHKDNALIDKDAIESDWERNEAYYEELDRIAGRLGFVDDVELEKYIDELYSEELADKIVNDYEDYVNRTREGRESQEVEPVGGREQQPADGTEGTGLLPAEGNPEPAGVEVTGQRGERSGNIQGDDGVRRGEQQGNASLNRTQTGKTAETQKKVDAGWMFVKTIDPVKGSTLYYAYDENGKKVRSNAVEFTRAKKQGGIVTSEDEYREEKNRWRLRKLEEKVGAVDDINDAIEQLEWVLAGNLSAKQQVLYDTQLKELREIKKLRAALEDRKPLTGQKEPAVATAEDINDAVSERNEAKTGEATEPEAETEVLPVWNGHEFERLTAKDIAKKAETLKVKRDGVSLADRLPKARTEAREWDDYEKRQISGVVNDTMEAALDLKLIEEDPEPGDVGRRVATLQDRIDRNMAALRAIGVTYDEVKEIENDLLSDKFVVPLLSYGNEGIIKAQKANMPETATWRKEFPNVMVQSTLSHVRNRYAHLHSAGKSGDKGAAQELVDLIVKPAKLRALKKKYPNAVVIYPHAEEAAGRNAIPMAYAEKFADAGFEVNTSMRQINRPHHTGATRNDRLVRQPRFEADIEEGQEYIIIDDHTTIGGTLRNMKDYIESKGGKVVAASTLTASAGGTILKITDGTLYKLKEAGITDEHIKELGIGDHLEGLTNEEGRRLVILADEGRNRRTWGGQQARIRISPRIKAEEESRRDAEDGREQRGDASLNRTGDGSLSETADEAWKAFEERVPDMSDEELLDAIRQMGMDASKADHVRVYDEYDKRHNEDYQTHYEWTMADLLRTNDYDRAQAILDSVEREWADGGFASDQRAQLAGQIDAAREYIDSKRWEFEGDDYQPDEGEQKYEAEDGKKVYYNACNVKFRPLEEGEFSHVERMYTEKGGFNFMAGDKVESPEDVAFIFKSLESKAIENAFAVLIKDGKPTVIHLGMGGFAAAPADLRVLVPIVDDLQPQSIQIVHNHPSGSLTPSNDDRKLIVTANKMFGGKTNVQPGMIIDTNSGYFSLFDDYFMTEERKEKQISDAEGVKVYAFDAAVFSPDYKYGENKLENDTDVAAFISSQRLGERAKVSLLVLGNNGQCIGNVHIPLSSAANSRELRDAIGNAVIKLGGTRAILYGTAPELGVYNIFDSTYNGLKKEYGIALVDSISITHNEGSDTYHAALSGEDIVREVESLGGVSEDEVEYGSREKVSPDDTEYMKAVKEGNVERQRELVSEAARKAMPETKVVDENGNPLVVYHGTQGDFNIFEAGKKGTRYVMGFEDEVESQGFFFSPDENEAYKYGNQEVKGDKKPRVIAAYLNMKHPADLSELTYESEELFKQITGQYPRGYDPLEPEIESWWRIADKHGDEYDIDLPKRLAELGYDGIIFAERGGQKSYFVINSEQIKSADTVTYDDTGKVIPLSERFDSGKKDIRWDRNAGRLPESEAEKLAAKATLAQAKKVLGKDLVLLSDEEARKQLEKMGGRQMMNEAERYKNADKSLVGMHNLTEKKLRHALKMGGLANPSTAVVDMNVRGMADFGDITLLMPSSMVAQKTGRNAGTWAADAYSPRYPVSSIVYNVGSKASDMLSKVLNADGILEKGSLGSTGQTIGYINSDGIEGLRKSLPVKIAFAKSIGENPIVASQSKYKPEVTEAIKQNAFTKPDEYGRTYIERGAWTDEQKQAIADAYKSAWLDKHGNNEELWKRRLDSELKRYNTPDDAEDWVKQINERDRKDVERYGAPLLRLEDFAMQVSRDAREAGDPDHYATERNANNIINAHKAEFDKWSQNLYDQLDIEEKIFDGYTPSGNRKYKAHTLENISRMMKQQGKAGGESFFNTSPGALRAKVAPIFSTLEQIRKAKGKLVAPEEFAPIKEQINHEFFELESLLEGDMSGDEGFYRLEEAMKHGAEWVNNRYKDIDLDKDDIERINTFRQLMYEAPTEYFETKFERPVMLDEFQAAVVPDGIDADLEKSLADNGLTIYHYDPKKEGDRERVQNEASMEEGIRFSMSANKADTFYSNAGKAVADAKMEKGTGEQWLNYLKNNGGLKAEEDKWMGLSDWLKEQGKAVSKDDVLKFIAENIIEIEEVKYGDDYTTPSKIQSEYNRYFQDELKRIGSTQWGDASENAWNRMVKKYGDDFKKAFWLNYDGEKYEVLVNSNDAARDFFDANTHFANDEYPINKTRLSFTTEGLGNKKEIALTVPTLEPYNANDNIHFGDAGDGRAVAWIRFGDANSMSREYIEAKKAVEDFGRAMMEKYNTDQFRAVDKLNAEEKAQYDSLIARLLEAKNAKTDGKKVLVIDEIQSKRHQDGREKGYHRSILAERNKIAKQWSAGGRKDDELWKRLQVLNDELRVAQYYQFRDSSVPDAPFRKNWHELAMKRMLRYAAENGYDKVAWTTGMQQSDRYGLSKVLDTVTKDSFDTDEEHTMFRLDFKNESQETLIIENATGNVIRGIGEGHNLSDVVGKEIAEKMMSMPEDKSQRVGNWETGGEGMKGFYDRMLPQFMDKYGKKWGVKTKDVTLDLPNEADRVMHAVDVTPEMKASVMEGQPMFYKTSKGEVYGWTEGGKVYLTESGLNGNTPVHEYTHLWGDAVMKRAPELWDNIKRLLKDTPAWTEVMNDEAYRNIHGNENELCSEVLSRLSGRKNQERAKAEAQKMLDEAGVDMLQRSKVTTLIANMKKAVNMFWDWVGKNLFGIKEFKSADEVTDRVLYDFWNKTDLKTGDILKRFGLKEKESTTATAEGIDGGKEKHSMDDALQKAVKQDFGSAETSINKNKVASAFKKIDWKAGTKNLDMGGGRYDTATELLAEKGVENMIYDPFNRDEAQNSRIAEIARNREFDTVTCNNCLNVINTAGARSNVILQCAKALKDGGTAYFSVYEGDKSGVGRKTQADSWQENRKTADYIDEVKEHFGDVTMKNGVVIAKNPKTDGKMSVWNFDASGEKGVKFSIDNKERTSQSNLTPIGHGNVGSKELNITRVNKEHGFNNYKDAIDWAKTNIPSVLTDEQTGGKGAISIPRVSISKFLSNKAVAKSDSRDLHYAVLKSLPDIIRESIDAEQHPDYRKVNGVRSPENGFNPGITMHRLYGAIDYEGKLHRVKITLKENKNVGDTKAYSYEATKIELLDGQSDEAVATSRNSNNSISVAKLLNKVEKSYKKGEYFFNSDEKNKSSLRSDINEVTDKGIFEPKSENPLEAFGLRMPEGGKLQGSASENGTPENETTANEAGKAGEYKQYDTREDVSMVREEEIDGLGERLEREGVDEAMKPIEQLNRESRRLEEVSAEEHPSVDRPDEAVTIGERMAMPKREGLHKAAYDSYQKTRSKWIKKDKAWQEAYETAKRGIEAGERGVVIPPRPIEPKMNSELQRMEDEYQAKLTEAKRYNMGLLRREMMARGKRGNQEIAILTAGTPVNTEKFPAITGGSEWNIEDHLLDAEEYTKHRLLEDLDQAKIDTTPEGILDTIADEIGKRRADIDVANYQDDTIIRRVMKMTNKADRRKLLFILEETDPDMYDYTEFEKTPEAKAYNEAKAKLDDAKKKWRQKVDELERRDPSLQYSDSYAVIVRNLPEYSEVVRQEEAIKSYKEAYDTEKAKVEAVVPEKYKEVVELIRNWYDAAFDDLKNAGMFDDASQKREKYVTHIWDFDLLDGQSGITFANLLRRNTPYTKQRTIKTLQEGIDSGLKLKYDDICDVMRQYSRYMNEAIANSRFADSLRIFNVEQEVVSADRKVIKIQKPLLIPRVKNGKLQDGADGYTTLDDAHIGKEYLVLQDYKPMLNNVFGSRYVLSGSRENPKTAKAEDNMSAMFGALKKANLSYSLFHHWALTESMLANTDPVYTAWVVGKNIAWDGLKGMLNGAPTPPAFADKALTEEVLEHHVKLSGSSGYLGDKANDIVAWLDDFVRGKNNEKVVFSKEGLTGMNARQWASIPTRVLRELSEGMDSFLWDYVHDAYKIYAYKYNAAQVKWIAKKRGWSEERLSRALDEVGVWINDTFGGQNMELIGISKRQHRGLGMLLMSADYTISTRVRQPAALLGFGVYHNNAKFWSVENLKNHFGTTEAAVRLALAWKNAIAMGLQMTVGYCIWNWVNRHNDEKKQKEIADKKRVTDPTYRSEYELAHPDGMTIWDYLPTGNTFGHRTHVFLGRDEDGNELYGRVGKQAREYWEWFYGPDGFGFPITLIDKAKSSSNPAIGLALTAIGGALDSRYPNQEIKEASTPWEKTKASAKAIAEGFVPFSLQKLAKGTGSMRFEDLFMPTAVGMKPYKARTYLTQAVIDIHEAHATGNEELMAEAKEMVELIRQGCVQNHIDFEKQWDAAVKNYESQQKEERMAGVDDIDDAIKQYDVEKVGKRKNELENYIKKQHLKQNIKPVTVEQAKTMANELVGGVSPINQERYVKQKNAQDIFDEMNYSQVKSALQEYKDLHDETKDELGNEAALEFERANPEVKKWRIMDYIQSSLIADLKKKMHGKNDKIVMDYIRRLRRAGLEYEGNYEQLKSLFEYRNQWAEESTWGNQIKVIEDQLKQQKVQKKEEE